MTGAAIAELARMVVAVLACVLAVMLLLAAAAVAAVVWPGGWSWPGRRYRGRRRARERAWLPW